MSYFERKVAKAQRRKDMIDLQQFKFFAATIAIGIASLSLSVEKIFF